MGTTNGEQKFVKNALLMNKASIETLNKTTSRQIVMQHPTERVKEIRNHIGYTSKGSKGGSMLQQYPPQYLPSGFDNTAAL